MRVGCMRSAGSLAQTGAWMHGSCACGHQRALVFGTQTLATFHLEQSSVSPPPWQLPKEALPAAVAAYAAGVEALVVHEAALKRGAVAARCTFSPAPVQHVLTQLLRPRTCCSAPSSFMQMAFLLVTCSKPISNVVRTPLAILHR